MRYNHRIVNPHTLLYFSNIDLFIYCSYRSCGQHPAVYTKTQSPLRYLWRLLSAEFRQAKQFINTVVTKFTVGPANAQGRYK